MKRFFKFIRYFLLAVLLLFLSRGFIFKTLIHYETVGVRSGFKLQDKGLIASVNKEMGSDSLSKNEIIRLANKITVERLAFTFRQTSSNPNTVYSKGRANCIGYAALFNAIGNYILQEKGVSSKYQISHAYGKIHFLGFDLHRLSQSDFFKDHDYNIILDNATKEKIKVDPSASDYLRIDRVH